jgi:trimeric autotransporter adhesin
MKISLEEKPMPGERPKKSYKRWLSITLIALCLINLLAPMLVAPNQGVNAQSQGLLNLNQCSANQSFEATMFALTSNNTLLSFNPGLPSIINSTVNISGLAQGESIVGIDFRPANGQLYALSSASQLYTINPSTGAATRVGAPLTTGVNGASFGFDFNPTVDRIRVVSNAEQDLRLNPNNAAVAGVDGALAYAATDVNAGQDPNIVGSAYTGNFSGSTMTTLYGIDSARDTLVTQGSVGSAPVSPNTGQLFTIGSLGIDTGDMVGFDIAPITVPNATPATPAAFAAFAALTPASGGMSTLYTINLATGAATWVGPIGGGRQTQTIRDIAYAVRPENVFAVTAGNKLIKFNPGVPGAINNSISISGIGGENIVGIDFRPATGQLFALSDASRIYTINTTNGVATPAGGAAFAPGLSVAYFGFDFNPTVDRIRLVSDADQNLRLNPNNGAIAATDGTLAYAATDVNTGQDPNIAGEAYTNSFLGSPTTTLFGIDTNLNTLVTQGSPGATPVSPNTGQLFTVGSLGAGIDPNGVAGFDISSESGAAFASFNSDAGGPTQIFQINLTTGAATLLGAVGVSDMVRDIAIEVRLPDVIALTASNLLVHFNAATPGSLKMIRVIRGLPRRERLVGLDYRPATGQLHAISASNRSYLIVLSDPAKALAVRLNPINPGLNGTNFGFDFNPVPDLIRLTSDGDQNLRINPNTGAVAGTDGTLAFAAGDPNAGANPNIVGSAYTNSFLGAKTTTLYGIDSSLGALVTQGSPGATPVSPNTGQLFTVGSLGVGTTGTVGFDISSPTNAAFASLTPSGANQSQLYTVNLMSGAATLIGGINVNETVTDITLGGVSRRGFDVCLQDDRSGTTLQFDSCTGDYQFSKCGAGAFVLTGRGITSLQGNVLTLRGPNVFALLNVNPGSSLRSGTAIVKAGRVFTVNDRNTNDNTCGCR